MNKLLLTYFDLTKTFHVLLSHHILFQSSFKLSKVWNVNAATWNFLFLLMTRLVSTLRLHHFYWLDLRSLLFRGRVVLEAETIGGTDGLGRRVSANEGGERGRFVFWFCCVSVSEVQRILWYKMLRLFLLLNNSRSMGSFLSTDIVSHVILLLKYLLN